MKKLTVLLTAIFISSCTLQKNVDISDYPIVTTVTELADYYDLKIDRSGAYESTSVMTFLDGAYELDYSYDFLEPVYGDPLFYNITIEREKTIKDAKSMYSMGKSAFTFAGTSFDQGMIEIDSLDLPGDESYYALRTYEGEPNGMYYILRKGKCVYTMIVSGMYTDDHSLINDLIHPRIEDLENFQIVKK